MRVPPRVDGLIDGKIPVVKIWQTIQGEGPRSGMPAVFVRLGYCHLRCFFCDTDFETGVELNDPKQIVEDVSAKLCTPEFNASLVVVTGGEPFLWDLASFAAPLIRSRSDIVVQVETSGAYPPVGQTEKVLGHPRFEVVVSPKTSKVFGKIARVARAYKYVIRHDSYGEDGLPVKSTQKEGHEEIIARPPLGVPVFLQPCDDFEYDDNLRAAVELCMKHNYRLSLQIHKLVGVE